MAYWVLTFVLLKYKLLRVKMGVLKRKSQMILIGVVFIVLIFAFAPGQWTPAWIVNHDKFSHLLVFFSLSVILSFAFPKLSLTKHGVFLMSFAVLIELVQYLFVGRGFSIEDIVYDLFGVLLFYTVVFWAKNKERLKQFTIALLKS